MSPGTFNRWPEFRPENINALYAISATRLRKETKPLKQNTKLFFGENEQFGLTKRDITHNINFFMNVPITQEGGLTFEDGISAPGKYVELKAAMDVIVLISNCPQLNNPCNAYNPTPIEVLVWNA